MVHVLPTVAAHGDLSTAGVIAVIVDSGRQPQDLSATLRRLYRLTPAEASVAVEVLRGEAPKSIAEKMSVLPSTVRTQLLRVFEKTGVHRQADLGQLLLTMEAGFNLSDSPDTGPSGAA
jgi:DNA-binding CsgD family transcriptional regulator